ncbi:MAG: rod shape-determining protein MreC, partial [Gammaproteobacteria bacterium]|nr:rod shape-determining protein MreC [Gammaproteobacteria bacterium]
RTLALMFLSVLLMLLDHRDNHLDAVRHTISAAVYPLRVIVDTPARMWAWAGESTQSRADLHKENDRLRAENLLTQARMQRLNALEAENSRLRAMLDAREQIEYRVRVAEIMAVDANPFRHTLIIDVGASDGVYDGQAIVDAAGVVGQVIETGPMTAEALLISDPGHALPVEVNRNGLRTIAYGTGDFSRLDLPGLANNADIVVGDLLVTSGLGGAFPSGYPVAEITAVNRIPQQPFADVSATPIVALDQVREVMLVWSSPGADDKTAEADDE